MVLVHVITGYTLAILEPEWLVGVTPDIRVAKARITQRRQHIKDIQSLKEKLTSVLESETSWLNAGCNGEDDKILL